MAEADNRATFCILYSYSCMYVFGFGTLESAALCMRATLPSFHFSSLLSVSLSTTATLSNRCSH